MSREKVLRREFLASLGLLGGGSLLLGCQRLGGEVPSSLAEETTNRPSGASTSAPPQQKKGNPGSDQMALWKWHPLDPEEVGKKAYALYPEGSCTYSTAGGPLAVLAERFGEPYSSFPMHVLRFGSVGIGGLGSVCGVISGGALLISLFVGEKDQKVRNSLIRELAFWYESTELPIFRPEKPEWAPEVEPSRSDSILCHISVLRWTQASGKDAYCIEKRERCRRVSCDGAMKTVEILNRHFAGQSILGEAPPETQTCISCHSEKQLRDIRGAMRCQTCHTALSEKHPKFEPLQPLKVPNP